MGQLVVGLFVVVGVLITYITTIPYAMFPDQGCGIAEMNASYDQGCNLTVQFGNGSVRNLPCDHEADVTTRNICWYTWFWDNWYAIIAVCMLCFNILEHLVGLCCISNWGLKYGAMLYIPAIVVVFTVNLAMKQLIEKMDWHDTYLAWPLFRLCICVSCTCAYACAIPFVAKNTKDAYDASFLYVRLGKGFVAVLVGLACFYFNQVYVHLYRLGQRDLLNSQYAGYTWVYDLAAALVFTEGTCQWWNKLLQNVTNSVSLYFPSSDEARVKVIICVWMETFKVTFSRILFSDASALWILALLVLKDSLANIVRFRFKYPPEKIIEKINKMGGGEKTKFGVKVLIRRAAKKCWKSIVLSYQGARSVTRNLPGFKERGDNFVRPTTTAPIFFETAASYTDDLDSQSDVDAGNQVVDYLDVRFAAQYEQRILRADRDAASNDTLDRVMRKRITRITKTAPAFNDLPGAEHMPLSATNGKHGSMSDETASRQRFCELPSRFERQCMPDAFWSRIGAAFAFTPRSLTRSEAEDTASASLVEEDDPPGSNRELLKQVSWVQRRLRLEFCGVYWAHLTSSAVGLTFVLTYKHFPCTVLAYGLSPEPGVSDLFEWWLVAILDVAEFVYLQWFHWNKRLEDDEESWKFVNVVLDNKLLMLACWASCAHVVTDTFLAFYRLKF